MATLPTPGGDNGTWGDELVEWLLVEHEADGTHNITGEQALDWQDVATGVGFQNGAANYGGDYRGAQYAKDATKGLVYMRGTVNPGSSGMLFTLPAGYRPSTNLILLAFADGASMFLEILPNGNVDFYGGPSTSASLEGIVFSL